MGRGTDEAICPPVAISIPPVVVERAIAFVALDRDKRSQAPHPIRVAVSSSRYLAKKYRDVRRALRDNGFRHLRTKGSHEVREHSDGRRVVLAGAGKDNRDVPAGTLKAIREQTGIDELR